MTRDLPNLLSIESLISYGIFAFYMGILILSLGVYKWLRNRRFEEIPRSKISNLPMGLVSIRGIARPYGPPLIAPISGKECVFYLGTFNSNKDGSFYSPFYLEDKKGKVLVDPAGINYIMNIIYPDFQGVVSYIKEWTICPGDMVSVIGTANIRKSYINDLKLKLNSELRRLKENPVELAKVDTNRNGTLETEEWDRKVNDIKKLALEQLLQSNENEEPQDRVVIEKGTEEQTFIMSKCSYFDYLIITPVQLIYIGTTLLIISALLSYYCRIH